MIVEQDEEDSEAVRIIKKDIPVEYGVLIQIPLDRRYVFQRVL